MFIITWIQKLKQKILHTNTINIEKEKFRVLNILIRELKLIYNFTHKFVYF